MTVYIVDDDAAIRDSLALMLGLEWSGCVVADLRLPGLSGIELQARVRPAAAARSLS